MGSANLYQPQWSFVYFVQAGENGPIKIGATSDPPGRMCALRTANAAPLKLLLILLGAEHEPVMHALFAGHRLQGEWFESCDDLNRFIREMIELSDCTLEVDSEDVPFVMMPSPRHYDRRGLCVDDVLRVVRDRPDREFWAGLSSEDWERVPDEFPKSNPVSDRLIHALGTQLDKYRNGTKG